MRDSQATIRTLLTRAAATTLLALLLLPVYLVVALRQPSHPPQDRLLGTYLVPA